MGNEWHVGASWMSEKRASSTVAAQDASGFARPSVGPPHAESGM